MSDGGLTNLLTEIGLPVLAVLVIAYVLLMPEKAQTVGGWLWSGIAKVFRRADRAAVALRVQGEVNSARARLLKHAPAGLMESKLKINWRNAEQAHAILSGDGDVIVFLRRSEHHEENVAHALMAYLPKAVLPRARRYVDKATMQAADFTIAKSVLGETPGAQGVLDVFYEQHLDPVCAEDAVLRQKIEEMDEIDLHGWLLHVLLPEFRRLGDQLHPSQPDPRCLADADAFARWLHRLAAREAGDESLPLTYAGDYLRIAVVWVALRQTIESKGAEPYRKRAKRLVYSGKYDAVYLMGRDHNMWAVREIGDRLRSDGLVASVEYCEYPLRADFAKRRLRRDRAAIACLVPKRGAAVDHRRRDDGGEHPRVQRDAA